MADTPRVDGDRLVFDDDVWADEVSRFDTRSAAHRAATSARRSVTRAGATVALRVCDAAGADGTRLRGCAKL